jgi:hypothetical protein
MALYLAGQPEQYETWSIASPLATHHRRATCAEVECTAHANGWTTTVDLGTELGRRQAGYIRNDRTRHCVERPGDGPGTVVFTFPAGQECFAAGNHFVPLDRPEIYRRAVGDGRRLIVPGTARRYDRGDQWADDMHTHTDRLATERGL